MSNTTLSLKRSDTFTNISLPDDYDYLVQSITVCAPSQKVGVDIDVTQKITLPAILESALLLVAQIETVSPSELGGFFGLSAHEQDVLVREMIDTNLVVLNEDGDLSTTQKLTAQRRDGASETGITIEDVDNYRDFTFIDLCTGHIQPRCESEKQLGLPMLPRTINITDFSQILAEQFDRFQVCLPNHKSKQQLRHPKSRLYRVNRASVIQSGLQQQITLDIHANHDPIYGIRLEPRLLNYKSEHVNLMQSSGLQTKAIDWLHNLEHDKQTISPQEYCDISRDTVFSHYIKNNGTIDLTKILHDKYYLGIKYPDPKTQIVIGPIYSSENIQIIDTWLARRSKKKQMHHGVWLGATNHLFGASIGLDIFMRNINESLSEGGRKSSLNLAFWCKNEGYCNERNRLRNTFGKRAEGRLISFSNGKSESHMELLVFPGESGCALVQFHSQIDPSLGFGGLTVPIGYFTTNQELVSHLWDIVRSRAKGGYSASLGNNINFESLKKQLEANTSELDELFLDESQNYNNSNVSKGFR